MNKLPVIKKENKFQCGQCKGDGCKKCKNKGYYIENHYYFVDHKNRIAFGSDNLA